MVNIRVVAPTDVPSEALVTFYPFYFVGNAPECYVVRAHLAHAPNHAANFTLTAAFPFNQNTERPGGLHVAVARGRVR